MNYGTIKTNDIANGDGVRVSLFVSGCSHHCKGCFNEETWSFSYGMPFDQQAENKIIDALSKDYIKGFSLLGGEPFEVVNQQVLVGLLKKIKEKYPEKDIWCYSGFTYEELTNEESRCHCKVTETMLSYIDILVDGTFKEELRDLMLKFRGSSNQRVINLKETRKQNKIILAYE